MLCIPPERCANIHRLDNAFGDRISAPRLRAGDERKRARLANADPHFEPYPYAMPPVIWSDATHIEHQTPFAMQPDCSHFRNRMQFDCHTVISMSATLSVDFALLTRYKLCAHVKCANVYRVYKCVQMREMRQNYAALSGWMSFRDWHTTGRTD